MSPAIGRRERLGVAGIVATLVAVASLPYLYGLATCPSDAVFLGLIGQNGQDQAFYLGWGPKQAEQGHVLFEDKYNGPAATRRVFNTLWLAMGLAARLTGVPLLIVFQLERIGFSILLLLVAHRILRRTVTGAGRRLLALALVAFGSGFGAFVVGPGRWGAPQGIFAIEPSRWTPDLWVVESNVFLTTLWEVVLPSATALLLLTLEAGYDTFFLERRSARRTALLTLLLGSVYPYAVVSVYGILGACALLRLAQGRSGTATLRDYLTVVAGGLPVILYDGFLVLANPDLTTGQALYASPGPWAYFMGFGVVSCLAVPGVARMLRRRRPADTFVLAWLAATALLVYLPIRLVPFQMQLILGVQVPLVSAASAGVAIAWRAAWRGVTRRRPGTFASASAATALVLACSATSFYHLQNVFVSLDRHRLPEYLDRATLEAIEWLATRTRDSDLVLSSPRLAPYIPVLASNRMYTGDYAAPTARFDEKQRAARWFFGRGTPRTDAAMRAFLVANRVDYVFYDAELAAWGDDQVRAQLDSLAGLEGVFRNGVVSIYRVAR